MATETMPVAVVDSRKNAIPALLPSLAFVYAQVPAAGETMQSTP